MVKKTITYKDFDGNERTEDFYFNLTEAEVAKMEIGTPGGITKMIERLVQEQNGKDILGTFENLIESSYGRKSPDGKYFDKNPKWLAEFKMTQAYSNLFIELISHPDVAAEFFNAVLPKVEGVAASAVAAAAADATAPVIASATM